MHKISENKISENQEIFHVGKNDSDEILWTDIPNVSSNLNSKENIAKLIRFAFSYNWMYGPALIGSRSKIKKYSNENVLTIDGVKINFEDSWVHLRKSNTEPIIRIYAEADSQTKVESLTSKIIRDIKEIISA